MISLLTMIVVVMIAFTSNVGQLVTERIALQNTADFAAYSAAATQAGVLNDIRRHNNRIWQAHKTAREYLETSETTPPPDFAAGGPCAVCSTGPYMCPQPKTNPSYEAAITAAKAVVSIETPIIEGLNGNMPNKARGAAVDSINQNYPGASLSAKGGSMDPADLDQDDIDLDYYGWGYVQFPYCPLNGQPIGSMQITHTTAKSWFFKKPGARGEVMFAVEVSGTPDNEFLGHAGGTYIGNYFGDRRQLKAYAAALPMAGKVGTISGGDFRTALEDKWSGSDSNSYVNDTMTSGGGHADKSRVLEDSQVTDKHYHDYKVRYVGIFESKAQFVNGSSLKSAFPSTGAVAH